MSPGSAPTAGGQPAGATSIICSVRNEARHVEAALRSALATAADEVLVVDDGSTDATGAILSRLEREHKRLRVVAGSARGRGAALAAALKASNSPLVMNLDADDLVHPEWVRLGSTLIAARPAFAVVAPLPHYLASDAHMTWPAASGVHTVRDVTGALAYLNPLVHSGAIMRREALASIGGYDVSLRTHFDYDLWIRLAEHGWALGRVDERLVCKRLHSGQKFERDGRLAYLWASARLQSRAIRAVHAGPWAWGELAGRLAWGVLPRTIRMAARRYVSR